MTRSPFLLLLPALPILAACAQMQGGSGPTAPGAAEVSPDAPDAPAEIAEVVRSPRPQAGANTVDALDTVTDEQRAAATAPPASAGRALGEQTASLGDPTDPGIWMRTALVSERRSGRVEVAGTGNSATVELIPLDGEGGAQLSLSAMRLLQIPLTDLPTVTVYGS